MERYQHIIRAVLARPWAIDPESLAWAAITDVLSLRAAGEHLSDQEIEARLAAAKNGPRSGARSSRNVAVIPVYGTITPRADLMSRTSGGTTAEDIRSTFRAALEDEDVHGIVFDVDSPGGVVEGIGELADEIRGARGTKPIAAVANHMAASAAYWAMAGVDEFVATPSASVGSIGVFTAHQDVSKAMEQKGVSTTLISAGKYKVERSQYAPLGEEALAAVQAEVNDWYATMTASIAKSRGVGVETVRSGFGEGRTLRGKRALEAGMIDRIGSLEETIRRVARGQVGSRPDAKAAYVVGIDLGSDGTPPADPAIAEAGAAPTFAARVEAAAAEARAIGAEARKRAELRAEDGREPSAADTLALALAAGLPPDEAEDEDPVDETGDQDEPPEASAPRKRNVNLELLEAAAAGGYTLPL